MRPDDGAGYLTRRELTRRDALRRLGIGGAVLAMPVSLAGCFGDDDGGDESVSGGNLRLGTTDGIDSLNPFVGFSGTAYTAFNVQYPTLVLFNRQAKFDPDWAESWETSPDGLTWTFKLKPGKWSDGRPLTAEDAVWTGETILKYPEPSGQLSAPLTHVKRLQAPDPQTLVITYEQPVGNVLGQMAQFLVLPKHVWSKHTGDKGKDLKTYDPAKELPIVSGGPFEVTKHDKKRATIFERNPGFYGEPPALNALGLQVFTNEEAMLAAMRAGDLDAIDDLAPTAVKEFKADSRFVVSAAPSPSIPNFIFNSNPDKPKNRELLDPELRKAFAHAINREEIAEVVYAGYADPVATLIAPNAGRWQNRDLKPEQFDPELANEIMDQAGYERGGDGVRVAPATTGKFAQPEHKLEYEILTDDSQRGINRSFEIVRTGLDEIGVKVAQKPLDGSALFEAIGAPDFKYLEFDLAMWLWGGLFDPDFMLNVARCNQYGGWSDTAYCNPEYDRLYTRQGAETDPKKREQLVWDMQSILYRDRPYIQLVNLDAVWVTTKEWELSYALTIYSKKPWMDAHRVDV